MWGLIILIGLVITQILVLSDSLLYIPILWIILVFVGFGVMSTSTVYGGKSSKEGIIWLLFVGIGFVLTASIVTKMVPLDGWYLGAIWLFLIGLGALMEGYSSKRKNELILGVFWVVTGLLLWSITKVFEYEFLYLAIVFGIPLILIGRYFTD